MGTSCQSPDLQGLSTKLMELIEPRAGPVLVQAGHLMAFASPSDEKCFPGVFEELSDSNEQGGHQSAIRAGIGVFPSLSWELGVQIVAQLRQIGNAPALITFVNDWQYVPKTWPGGAQAARKLFYEKYSFPLPTYESTLLKYGLDHSVLGDLGRHSGFVSEHWLRRRLARHLSNMKRKGLPGAERLYRATQPDGSPCMRFEPTQGADVCLVVYGSSDCAGEMTELLHLANADGFRTIVNLYPLQCENPVNEGARRGIDLFNLKEFRIINCGLSCAGEAEPNILLNKGVRIRILEGDEERSDSWPT